MEINGLCCQNTKRESRSFCPLSGTSLKMQDIQLNSEPYEHVVTTQGILKVGKWSSLFCYYPKQVRGRLRE